MTCPLDPWVSIVPRRRAAALVEGEADGALAERSHHSDSQPQHGPKEYKISILSHKLMF